MCVQEDMSDIIEILFDRKNTLAFGKQELKKESLDQSSSDEDDDGMYLLFQCAS
jgi:hypothetical protein